MGIGVDRQAVSRPNLLLVTCCLLLVTTAVLLIYWPALNAYFYEDDFQWLVSRWSFHPSDLVNLGSWDRFYRPVIDLYFWIGLPLFRGSPWWFHAASIALHLANCALTYRVAVALGWRRIFAFVAALLFAVEPAHVDGAAWIGALAEPLVVFFGSLSLLALLRFRRTGRVVFWLSSVCLFGLSLLSHQSAIVLLPLLVMADWMEDRQAWRAGAAIRRFLPYVVLAVAFLAIEATVNSRQQMVASGEYRAGLHVIRNTLDYVSSLYAGKHSTMWLAASGVVLAVVMLIGSWRARFATVWTILSILPFALFDVPNVSRYAYMPAVGFAWLVAEGFAALDRRLAYWKLSASPRSLLIGVLIVVATVRFGSFAQKNVRIFALRAEHYRTFLTDLRREHPTLPDGTIIPIDAKTDLMMPRRYLEAAVQWEYRNTTLRVEIEK